MLPARHRLGGRREFTRVVGHGVRVRRGSLVVHLIVPSAADAAGNGASTDAHAAKAGFVVSRAVGGSVTRHAVVRRLRHVAVPLLAALPDGSQVVVRALPAAATARSEDLAQDLAGALTAARARCAS